MKRLHVIAGLALFAVLFLAAPAARAQEPTDDATDRALYGLAEEQAMLARQIQRLRQTMDVLAGRLEAEGRTRAVELLREGLRVLDKRGEEAAAMTLDERMDAARDELSGGQWMQSLERQEEIIGDLEALLEVLLDRQDLDKLEQRIEELAAAKADLENLRGRQDELQRETKTAEEQAIQEQLGDLMNAIETLSNQETAALAQTEAAARESGALEAERIEAAVAELATREGQLAALLEAWSSEELAATELAAEQLESAAEVARDARQSERVAEALTRAAEALGDDAPFEQVAKQLERNLSATSPTEKAALEAALAELAKAPSTGRSATQQELEAAAARARKAAGSQTAEARSAAEAASEQLQADGDAKAKAALTAALESPSDSAGELSRALEAALETLRRAASDARFLPEAAAGAQAENGRAAGDLGDALERLIEERQTKTGAEAATGLSEALARLSDAKDAMAASRAATTEMPSDSGASAAAAAKRAKAALEQALAVLGAAAKSAAGSDAQARAQAQAALGEAAGQLSEQAPGDSKGSLEEARDAMQKAAEALAEGRSGEAAKAQREALDALDVARREARASARPNTSTNEALAEKQKQIEDDLLDLATRLEEKQREEAAAAVQSAASEASKASESLGEGDMQSAGDQERRVQEELDKAKNELEAEEEKYQELRREEILIQLTEELQALLEAHQAQLAEVVEVETARAGRETPSRAQKLRLRRAARQETTLAEKASELTGLLQAEDSEVFATAMDEVRGDLEHAAEQLGAPGASAAGVGFDSGWRTQAVMRDAERLLTWLSEALTNEAQRRRDEPPPPPSGGQQPPSESENRLVPSQAELRLLRSMELDVQRTIQQTIDAYPELEGVDPSDIDPLILGDLMRLAGRHNRVTELFRSVAKKLGIPGIGE